jgi:dTDP-4-amino-4,6-dideoxygalactose transaminase
LPELDWYRGWQDVLPEDLDKVSKALSGGALSVVSGGLLERFERSFARFAGSQHAVALNNGTGALHVALRALDVGPGDEVLMCDYGFHGMAAAVLATGATIVPVDCQADSLAMDAEDLQRARSARSKAILVHNPWGIPADYQAIRQAAGDLPLISDASHAHGATYQGKPLAAWATITCFSLGHQKLISGGELGCAVTDDPRLRDRMLIEGHVNRVPKDIKLEPWQGNAVGLKMRPHPAAMVLASAQLSRFPDKLSRLGQTCRAVEERLRPLGLRGQSAGYECQRVWWKIVLRPSDDVDLETVRAQLRESRIPLEENHYHPTLQRQEIFAWPRHRGLLRPRPCPLAHGLAPRLITLPAPVVLPDEVWQDLGRFLVTMKEPDKKRSNADSSIPTTRGPRL